MSEALYRTYRPQTFDEVVGQTHIERTLKNAIQADKVSHAYLFCGPRGTGKTTTARLLAKALLCDSGPTPAPDGTCEQCQAIAQGIHPDVIEMDAASRTGVENVREEIIGRVQYAPTRGRFKIYIIDEVHMLSPAAFNALLKTLEEPPSHVVFVLCTTDPQKILETIQSRCQRFDFHRLSVEEIVSRLGAVCMAEGVQFEGEALELVAHRAQGGMRDALTSLEQLIAFGNGNVTAEVARAVLGSLDENDMSAIMEALAARDAAACFTWVADYIETGADLAQFTRDLAGYVRNLYVLELTGTALGQEAPSSSQTTMAEMAKRFGPDRLAYLLRVLGDLSTELRSSINARLSFEIALTRMVRPESDLTLESLAARIETLEEAIRTGAGMEAERVLAAGGTATGTLAGGAAKAIGNDAAIAAKAGCATTGAQSGDTPAGADAAPLVARAPRAQDTQAPESSWPTPSASVPRTSVGYKPVAREEAPTRSAAELAMEAVSKAAALRSQIEQRTGTHPSEPAAAAVPSDSAFPATTPAAFAATAPAAAPTAEAAVAPGASDGSAGESVRAKLTNPAALQRGWQAALAELKRQRAVYAALMQSARIMANPDGSGIVVEFSKENDFAFSAAQKPDVSTALSSALAHAFGDTIPFRITQGSSIAASMRAAASAGASADAGAASGNPAAHHPRRANPASIHPTAPKSTAGHHAAVSQPTASSQAAAQARPAAAISASTASPARATTTPSHTASHDVSTSARLETSGPVPVDPSIVGRQLGFELAAFAERPQGTVLATGWPGITEHIAQNKASADPSTPFAQTPSAPTATSPFAGRKPPSNLGHASAGSSSATRAPAAANAGVATPFLADTPTTTTSASEGAASPVNNPAAGIPAATPAAPTQTPSPAFTPAPAAPAPAAAEDTMDLADIFGAFGVSMEDVQEEGGTQAD